MAQLHRLPTPQRASAFDAYQDLTATLAIYPGAGTGSTDALTYVGLGLGEAGEIQNQLKKVLRDDAGELSTERVRAIRAEAGDLLFYLARLAEECGLTLSEIAAHNVAKLCSRRERGVLGGSGDDR